MLQGAGTGLMLGAMTGNPFVAAGGAIAGGLYGAFSSNADYNAKRLAAVKRQLQEAGHGDVAAKISETELAPGAAPSGLDADDRAAFGDADREIARSEETLKQVMSPLGQDLAAIRQHVQGQSPQAAFAPSAAGGYGVPAADYSAMNPQGPAPGSPAAVAAATSALAAAAADRAAISERYGDMQRRGVASMRSIMELDPMRSTYARPAPEAAPAPLRRPRPGARAPSTGSRRCSRSRWRTGRKAASRACARTCPRCGTSSPAASRAPHGASHDCLPLGLPAGQDAGARPADPLVHRITERREEIDKSEIPPQPLNGSAVVLRPLYGTL